MLISREALLSELVKEGNDANVVYANRRKFRAGVAEGLRLANVIARSESVTPNSKESPADSPASPVQQLKHAIDLLTELSSVLELYAPNYVLHSQVDEFINSVH